MQGEVLREVGNGCGSSLASEEAPNISKWRCGGPPERATHRDHSCWTALPSLAWIPAKAEETRRCAANPSV